MRWKVLWLSIKYYDVVARTHTLARKNHYDKIITNRFQYKLEELSSKVAVTFDIFIWFWWNDYVFLTLSVVSNPILFECRQLRVYNAPHCTLCCLLKALHHSGKNLYRSIFSSVYLLCKSTPTEHSNWAEDLFDWYILPSSNGMRVCVCASACVCI